MSPWWLLLIVPVAMAVGAVVAVLVVDWFIVIYYGEWWNKR